MEPSNRDDVAFRKFLDRLVHSSLDVENLGILPGSFDTDPPANVFQLDDLDWSLFVNLAPNMTPGRLYETTLDEVRSILCKPNLSEQAISMSLQKFVSAGVLSSGIVTQGFIRIVRSRGMS